MKKLLFISLISILSSCACEPEQIAHFAFQGMEAMMGEGFMPSDEIRALGNFQEMNVGLNKSSETGSTIFLKLGNGDPKILSSQREILARKCAELYLRDFENAKEYDQITVQFIQTDPQNPENVAMEEYEFQVSDFDL
ncbi:hypothetical protein DFQ04_2202 [Algoriphagus boseongensis]|uniref:Uncharacterized protein n=1 Tax=Algoriphagus boseongensis TaxID=1442587 RepID=A0A4R6T989_9BACT|nr:hypothetical protein [Algoriphagus boseongensis]TDQ17548.1 hypothetical protein DFQ04_2202 [Algoriphagus boseongensis]